MTGRSLLSVAVAAAFVLAAAYYGRHESGTEQSGSTESAPPADVESEDVKDRPVAGALAENQGERVAQENGEAEVPSSTIDERVRSFTTPVERALAGMEELKLKVPF